MQAFIVAFPFAEADRLLVQEKAAIKTTPNKATIIDYLTNHDGAKSVEIAASLGLKASRTKTLLSQMVGEGSIIAEGENRNRTYRLKS